MIKRLLDLLLLFTGIILFLPVFLLIFIVVIINILFEDGSPIFYTQTRYGKNMKTFQLYKFRSMIKNAEYQTGPIWASRNTDTRITKTGRLMRKYAIDEIPQLYNILRGDISFVGPRPERPELFNKFIKNYPRFAERLDSHQGLSGLAQLLGKYDSPPKNKLRYDLLYIKNQSILLDLKIIFLSVFVTIIGNWQSDSRKWVKKFF